MNNKINNIIDLELFRTQIGSTKSKIFTGRDRGEEVRNKSKIDEIFEKYDSIKIIIPKEIYSITPSFLEEYFYNIVKKFGKEHVESHIKWDTNGYSIEGALEEAFERILRRINGLDN